MLAHIKNEFLYANLRKQVICFLCGMVILSGLLFYFFIKPELSSLKIEKIKNIILQQEERLMPEEEKTSFLALSESLNHIAVKTKIAIKIRNLGSGSLELTLAGGFEPLLGFIQAVENLDELIAIEKLQLEKRKNIQAQMVLLYWESPC